LSKEFNLTMQTTVRASTLSGLKALHCVKSSIQPGSHKEITRVPFTHNT